MMKTKILTALLVLSLSASALLTSCGGNMNNTPSESESGTQSMQTEESTKKGPVDEIIDGAQRGMDGMRNKIEDSTHGFEDGTPGGDSARDFGQHRHVMPRGK